MVLKDLPAHGQSTGPRTDVPLTAIRDSGSTRPEHVSVLGRRVFRSPGSALGQRLNGALGVYQ
jgi:hypothetical protein